MLLPFVLVVSIPSPWLSDLIGSKVFFSDESALWVESVPGCFGSASLPWFWGMLVSLLLGFRAVVSCFSAAVFSVFFFSLSLSVWKSFVSGGDF